METARTVGVGTAVAMGLVGAWWLLAPAPEPASAPEPAPVAAPSSVASEPEPEAPHIGKPLDVAAAQREAHPAPVAGPLDTDDALDSDQLRADAAAFLELAGAAMTRKVDALHRELAAGVQAAGPEGPTVRRLADAALVEIRQIATRLDGDAADIGAAFGDVERVRDLFGERVDAALPADRAAAVKAAAKVRTPDEAANALDWGIPVDEATAEEVFR